MPASGSTMCAVPHDSSTMSDPSEVVVALVHIHLAVALAFSEHSPVAYGARYARK